MAERPELKPIVGSAACHVVWGVLLETTATVQGCIRQQQRTAGSHFPAPRQIPATGLHARNPAGPHTTHTASEPPQGGPSSAHHQQAAGGLPPPTPPETPPGHTQPLVGSMKAMPHEKHTSKSHPLLPPSPIPPPHSGPCSVPPPCSQGKGHPGGAGHATPQDIRCCSSSPAPNPA